MISCYERSLFEQQTPYLQWLKERENTKKIAHDSIKGKQIRKLPFFSCEESVEELIKEPVDILRKIDFVLFYGAKGFLEQSAEGYFADYFAEHDDVVIVYADEDYLGTLQEFYGDRFIETEIAREYRFGDTAYYRGMPWFKPDFSPDTLRSFFYFGNVFAIRGAVLADYLDKGNSANMYEMVVKLTQKSKYAGHISEVLFTNEVKMQEKAYDNDKNQYKLLKNEMQTSNVYTKNKTHGLCKQKDNNSLISIIIPSKDNSKILKRCLSTLVDVTDYPYYEILLVDNGSSEQELTCIREIISEIQEDYDLKWADDDKPKQRLSIQYIYQKAEFNFSVMCNLGAKAAKGEYLLFLNDDMEIIDSSWLKRMMEQSSLSHVGAVGAKLYYPHSEQEKTATYRIQHVGITNMGIGPAHKLAGMEDKGDLYHGHNLATYNMLAVTAACLMVRKERFWEVDGFDETLAVAYNDVEFCFKLYEKGYYNVQRNDVVLLHHESLSRGQDTSPEKAARLEQEKTLLYEKHPLLKGKDPFYSEHLVQWKKDVAYSCNYLYPYDKISKPRLLNESEVQKLPKEHQNKYIRKLTGENLSMLQIDQMEASEAEGTLLIKGWYVMRECDNATLQRTMLLKNMTGREIYELAVYPKLRYDVEALFQQQTENADSGTRNTALSGIQCIIDKSEFARGSYQIGMMITRENKSKKTRKICWKKDCVVNV